MDIVAPDWERNPPEAEPGTRRFSPRESATCGPQSPSRCTRNGRSRWAYLPRTSPRSSRTSPHRRRRRGSDRRAARGILRRACRLKRRRHGGTRSGERDLIHRNRAKSAKATTNRNARGDSTLGCCHRRRGLGPLTFSASASVPPLDPYWDPRSR